MWLRKFNFSVFVLFTAYLILIIAINSVSCGHQKKQQPPAKQSQQKQQPTPKTTPAPQPKPNHTNNGKTIVITNHPAEHKNVPIEHHKTTVQDLFRELKQAIFTAGTSTTTSSVERKTFQQIMNLIYIFVSVHRILDILDLYPIAAPGLLIFSLLGHTTIHAILNVIEGKL